MNLFVIFLTGLTAGGLSCLAMQGGLFTSLMNFQKETKGEGVQQAAEDTKKETLRSIMLFLGAKLIAYTLLGFLLGSLGSVVTLSLNVRLFFQVATSIFLFVTALNLLEVHPIFRFAVFQPPKWMQRKVVASTKQEHSFAPALLGLMTILIPCGVTQAMELVALSTGSGLKGAAVMFAFVLGTLPLFAIVGALAASISGIWHDRLLVVSAVLLLCMSVYGMNGVLTVVDAPITLSKIVEKIKTIGQPPAWYSGGTSMETNAVAPIVDGVSRMTIQVTNRGYVTSHQSVKVGVPVELTLTTSDVFTCASSFTMRKYGIAVQLQPTDTKTVRFTPTDTSDVSFACSMGMYTGVLHVIK